MSGRSVNLTTLFLDRLINQYLVSILLAVTDQLPLLIGYRTRDLWLLSQKRYRLRYAVRLSVSEVLVMIDFGRIQKSAQSVVYIVSPLYNDIRYNSKIRYNVDSVNSNISGSCILLFCRKTPFWIFVRSPHRGDSNKYSKGMISKKCSKESVIHALDGSISNFFITANSILQQDLW